MSQEESSELDRLRRAAFGRDATAEDRAALERYLAERESPSTAPAPPVPEEPDPVAVALEPTAETPTEPAPGLRRRPRLLLAIAIALAAGLVVGGAGGWAIAALQADGQRSSLAVFETPADPEVEAAEWAERTLVRPEVRSLGRVGDAEFYGLTGAAAPDNPIGGDLVCLDVRLPEEAGGGACTSIREFRRSGVSVMLGFDSAGGAQYSWGPTGPPGVVTCAPQEWPDRCP